MRIAGLVALGVLASACSADDARPPVTVRASLGTFEDGSGRLGLSALATIREEGGAPPSRSFTLELRDAGAVLEARAAYAAHAPFALVAWPDVVPSPGASFELVATNGDAASSIVAALGDPAPLAVPDPALALDGSRLEWSPVARAPAYACVLAAGGDVQLQSFGADPACDLSALPPGAYRATVDALSDDPAAFADAAAPELPARFDRSEARLGILRRDGGASLALRAAGGRIDYGLVPGLAIWVALTAPDGTAAGGTWSIEVTGPNLPASDPLRFDLPAGFARRAVWAYELPPEPGRYTLTARSGADAVTTEFSVGAPSPLPLPDGVSATGLAAGAARMTWSAVPGARSYFVAAWAGATFVAGQWVTGTTATFPQGSFTPGAAYDAYVTALDADLVGGAVPTRVSASENAYQPASFVSP